MGSGPAQLDGQIWGLWLTKASGDPGEQNITLGQGGGAQGYMKVGNRAIS